MVLFSSLLGNFSQGQEFGICWLFYVSRTSLDELGHLKDSAFGLEKTVCPVIGLKFSLFFPYVFRRRNPVLLFFSPRIIVFWGVRFCPAACPPKLGKGVHLLS